MFSQNISLANRNSVDRERKEVDTLNVIQFVSMIILLNIFIVLKQYFAANQYFMKCNVHMQMQTWSY